MLLWKQLKILLTDVLLASPVENWQQFDGDSDDEMEVEGAVDLVRRCIAIFTLYPSEGTTSLFFYLSQLSLTSVL